MQRADAFDCVHYGTKGDSGNFGNGGDAGGLSGRESFSLDFEIILASFCESRCGDC